MKKASLLAAATAVAALAITPAMAKDMRHSHKHAGHHASMKHDRMSERRAAQDANAAYRADAGPAYRNDFAGPRTGFFPLDATGAIVGGAVGTAGAIAGTAVGTAGAVAAAPFGQGPYAYGGPAGYGYRDPGYSYNGTAIQTSPSYAARNGFVCEPGTWFRDDRGQQRICQ